MTEILRQITAAGWFRHGITGVIVLAGLLVGIETYPQLARDYAQVLGLLDTIILTVFVLEIVIKVGACGSRPLDFFRDPWNVFDFVIIAGCFLPVGAEYAMVLRLLRLLRVVRLINVLPKLQMLVAALLRSIPSMGYISLFLLLLFYLYAVVCVMVFGRNDPIHFATLPLAMLSLFRVVTLEDWTDIMYIQMKGCAGYEYYAGNGYGQLCSNSEAFPIFAPLFFSSFVLIGTMVILNLFIGVIMNSMTEAQEELESQLELKRMKERGLDTHSLEHLLYELHQKVHRLSGDVAHVQKVAGERGWIRPGGEGNRTERGAPE